jgi:4-amino-4-deoxy-L-arabinose transferase-like glycosyltransferase
VFSFWAPADGGIDQNAYLVGGKQIALTGSTGVHLSNPFQYVGHMFVVPTQGDGFYPKYPFGLPLLYAAVIRCAGWTRGVTLAFAVSPVCAVLAVMGTFFLARAVAGSFAGALAALALAGSEVMWKLCNVANSHASCVAFVVWGMYFLISWWQRGSLWRGLLSGLLLGFACLIRYTEGLLIVPILLAVAFRIRWRNWQSYLRSAARSSAG